MTTAAPELNQLAPNVIARVKDGDLTGNRNMLLGVGLVAFLASAIIGFASGDLHHQFLFSYLVAYMFTLSLCLGALLFVMIQHVTRAGWSVVVRRLAENMASCMWLMAVLFIPIAIGYHDLYHHWAGVAEGVDELLDGKSAYLNSTFFFIRAAIYFLVWIGFARFFCGSSLKQDQNGDPGITLRMSRLAAPGILIMALTLTFAAFDWIMSLDPHWFSTIFGVTYFAGSMMALLATLGLFCMFLGRKGYLKGAVNVEHYHDIGKLLFAFMIFWTYVNFSQYFLIWYANLPEETLWYQHRAHGSWEIVGTILILGHFLLPFAFLMSRHIKRNTKTLAAAAIFLLVMHWMDMQFLIMPMHETDAEPGMHLHWMDAVTMIGLLGLFFGLTLHQTIRSPLLPQRDPRLEESLHFHNI